jgi:hypothetical protein
VHFASFAIQSNTQNDHYSNERQVEETPHDGEKAENAPPKRHVPSRSKAGKASAQRSVPEAPAPKSASPRETALSPIRCAILVLIHHPATIHRRPSHRVEPASDRQGPHDRCSDTRHDHEGDNHSNYDLPFPCHFTPPLLLEYHSNPASPARTAGTSHTASTRRARRTARWPPARPPRAPCTTPRSPRLPPRRSARQRWSDF